MVTVNAQHDSNHGNNVIILILYVNDIIQAAKYALFHNQPSWEVSESCDKPRAIHAGNPCYGIHVWDLEAGTQQQPFSDTIL